MGRLVLWTDEENDFLLENAPNMTVKELTAGLAPISVTRRHTETVRKHCSIIGVKPKAGRKTHKWTEEEKQFLRDNYPAMKPKKLAAALGVTVLAVNAMLHKGKNSVFMKRRTPWVTSMLRKIPGMGETLYEMSCRLHDSGQRVSIEQNDDGQMALYCRQRRG